MHNQIRLFAAALLLPDRPLSSLSASFFNILGKMNVPAENFPFCTIDPNVAIVPVPDGRFKWLCRKYKPASEVPPNMTITDIAGLVKVRFLVPDVKVTIFFDPHLKW